MSKLNIDREQFWTDDVKRIIGFIKRHAWIILVSVVFGYLGGVTKTEIDLELDCKYAKATRIGGSAWKCERMI